ncbi:Rossmann-like and DUF2520 domain-containing protein [Chitinophagaceae bacterium LWZ2-11]
MQVTIIGTGNVAAVLGKLIIQKGHEVVEICGRNEQEAKLLADKLHTGYTSDLYAINKGADIYIIAVSDNAIEKVSNEINVGNKLIVHTAGSGSKELLCNSSTRYGVLWPIQSLRKEIDEVPVIPFAVAGNDESSLLQIETFAQTLSGFVSRADDLTRRKLHLAAVLSSNFSNYLYAATEEFCNREQLDFGLLYPLIQTTADRLQLYSPSKTQTGPAVRNDEQTIQAHLKLLQQEPKLAELYKFMTEQIRK